MLIPVCEIDDILLPHTALHFAPPLNSIWVESRSLMTVNCVNKEQTGAIQVCMVVLAVKVLRFEFQMVSDVNVGPLQAQGQKKNQS